MEQRKGSVTITKASLCTTMERWGGGSLGAKTSKPAQLSCPHLHPYGLSGALLHLQTAFVVLSTRSWSHYSRVIAQGSIPWGPVLWKE